MTAPHYVLNLGSRVGSDTRNSTGKLGSRGFFLEEGSDKRMRPEWTQVHEYYHWIAWQLNVMCLLYTMPHVLRSS